MEYSLRKVKDEIRSVITTVSSNLTFAEELTILHNIDYETFRNEYAYLSRPLIIKNGAARWPLTKNGLQLFNSKYGKLKCTIRKGDYSTGIQGRGYFSESITTVGEYIKLLNNNDISITDTYAPYQVVPNDISDILLYQDWLPSESVNKPIHYWLGPKRSYIAIHSDTCDKLIYQSHGEKEWCLIAPHFFQSLYLFEDFGRGFDVSPINPFEPDINRYPKYKDVPVIKFKVTAGDIFFLPGGWYHSVRSLNTSLSFEYKSNPVPFSIKNDRLRNKFTDNIFKIKSKIITK